MFQDNVNRNYYARPNSAKGFRSIEEILISSDPSQVQKIRGNVPNWGVARPLNYSHYLERDLQEKVTTSGHVALLGGGTLVGISNEDAKPGQKILYNISGNFWQELDRGSQFEGDGRSRVASATTDLAGKPAYYLVLLGKWTSVKPANIATEPYIQAGIFLSDAVAQPYASGMGPGSQHTGITGIGFGVNWVQVKLENLVRPTTGLADPPTVAPTCDPAEICDIYAAPTVTQNGLMVTVDANAVSGNPQRNLGQIKWNFTGAVDGSGNLIKEASGETASFEYDSAGAKTITIMVPSCDHVSIDDCDCCINYEVAVTLVANEGESIICPPGSGAASYFTNFATSEIGDITALAFDGDTPNLAITAASENELSLKLNDWLGDNGVATVWTENSKIHILIKDTKWPLASVVGVTAGTFIKSPSDNTSVFDYSIDATAGIGTPLEIYVLSNYGETALALPNDPYALSVGGAAVLQADLIALLNFKTGGTAQVTHNGGTLEIRLTKVLEVVTTLDGATLTDQKFTQSGQEPA